MQEDRARDLRELSKALLNAGRSRGGDLGGRGGDHVGDRLDGGALLLVIVAEHNPHVGAEVRVDEPVFARPKELSSVPGREGGHLH
jgi:hypothetical protein